MSITFTEKFNVENLKIILKNKDYFKKLLRPESVSDDYDTFKICEKYLKKSKNGMIDVTYRQNDNKGRFYAEGSLSLQNIPREIRGSIANDLYYDIDMVNSHIVLVEYICRIQLDYNCEFLSDYIFNRENKIADILKINPKLDRHDVKNIILAILYGGSLQYQNLKNKTKWIDNFCKEIQHIFNLLKDKFPKKFKNISKSKSFNAQGSLLSHLACELENQLLQIMIEYFRNNNIVKNVCCLCFDGILVPKGKLTEDKLNIHLREIEASFSKIGINMKLLIKPMEALPLSNILINDDDDDHSDIDNIESDFSNMNIKDLDFTKLYELGSEVSTSSEFDSFSILVKKFMDMNYCLITHQTSAIVIAHTIEDDHIIDNLVTTNIKRHYLTLNSFKVFLDNKIIYTNYKIKGKGCVEIDLFNIWYNSRFRNERCYINFDPCNVENKSIYNLWSGYRISYDMCRDAQPLTIESPLLNHLFKRWALGNIDVYKFIMGWLASTIQLPQKKLSSCLVIRGKEGSGKGTPFMFMKKIMGEKYISQPSSPNSVLGDFNSSLEGIKLLFMDELVWGGDKQKAGVLKKLTTEDTIEINRKHLPAYTVKNLLNICMSSNEDWVVPAGLNARRYLVCDIDNELSGVGLSKEKKEILKQILNTNILSFAKTLYEWDLSSFDDRDCPQTDALRQQKILSFGPVDKYWHECLVNGYIIIDNRNYEFGTQVPKEAMFNSSGVSNRFVSSVQFWKQIHNISPIINIRKNIAGIRSQYVSLPELIDARNAFKLHVGDPNWQFPDILEITETTY